MKVLSEDEEKLIDGVLYTEVMLLIESQYNLEGIIDINKKDSSKIIFKDKKTAIQKVAEAIERFAENNNLDKNVVKEHLLSTIRRKIELKNMFKEEFEEAEEIVSKDYDEEQR